MLIVSWKKKKRRKEKLSKFFCLGCALSTCKLPPTPKFLSAPLERSSSAPQTTHCLFYWCSEPAIKLPLGSWWWDPSGWIFQPPNTTTFKVFLFKINLLLPDWNRKQRKVYKQTPNTSKGSNKIKQEEIQHSGYTGQKRIWLNATSLSVLLSPLPPWPCTWLFPKGWKIKPKVKLGN